LAEIVAIIFSHSSVLGEAGRCLQRAGRRVAAVRSAGIVVVAVDDCEDAGAFKSNLKGNYP
jgi:hypothetical protein